MPNNSEFLSRSLQQAERQEHCSFRAKYKKNFFFLPIFVGGIPLIAPMLPFIPERMSFGCRIFLKAFTRLKASEDDGEPLAVCAGPDVAKAVPAKAVKATKMQITRTASIPSLVVLLTLAQSIVLARDLHLPSESSSCPAALFRSETRLLDLIWLSGMKPARGKERSLRVRIRFASFFSSSFSVSRPRLVEKFDRMSRKLIV